MPSIQPHSYTHLDIGEVDDVVVCNDCGAFADSEDEVVHHASCRPGESQYWQAMYDQPDPEEEFDAEAYANHQYDGVDFGEDDDDEPE